MHGAQSNNAVTKLQLENLHITEEDYDIFYLHGSIEESEIHPSLEGLVKGPFYSWFDKESSKENSSLITAVKDVVSAVKHHGPFDGIYGFSSGGVVAALAANLTKDPTLQDAVKNTTEGHRFSQFGRFSVRNSPIVSRENRKSMRQSKRVTTNNRASTFGRMSLFPKGRPQINVDEQLFKFAILACPAASDIAALRSAAGLDEMIEPGTIPVSSFHLIGIEDGFKSQSEKIASLFSTRQVMYMAGGHTVSRDVSSDVELCASVRKFTRSLGQPTRRSKASSISGSSLIVSSLDLF